MATQPPIEYRLRRSIGELADRTYWHQVELYLDPVGARFYTLDTPRHPRRRWVCTIPAHAIPASVAEVAKAHIGHLVAMVEALNA